MRRQLARSIIIVGAMLLSIAGSHAQDVRTQAPCSPVVGRTQGNVTLICTVGTTPAQLQDIVDNVLFRRAIPSEFVDRYDQLSPEFRVTDTALTIVFHILGENKVAMEDLDAKLTRDPGTA